MAVTDGHGNPNWTRDETILALDLYFKCEGHVPGPKDPRVVNLSNLIRGLPIHIGARKRDSFRNPEGVAFKLQNLRQVATGKGLGNVSATDREVWQDFGDTPDVVKSLAEAIAGETGEALPVPEEGEVFKEGRIITAVHLRRERDARLRTRVLKNRRRMGPLKCDCCGDNAKAKASEYEDAGFEVHHRLPLAMNDQATETRLQDVALLCATCHRLIHRLMSSRKEWQDIEDLKVELVNQARE